jgi:hypothetical protein
VIRLDTFLCILTSAPIALVVYSLFLGRSKQHRTIKAGNLYQSNRRSWLLLGQCLIPALQLPQALRGLNDPRPTGIVLENFVASVYPLPCIGMALNVSSSLLLIRAGKVALPALGFANLMLIVLFFMSNYAPVP